MTILILLALIPALVFLLKETDFLRIRLPYGKPSVKRTLAEMVHADLEANLREIDGILAELREIRKEAESLNKEEG